MMSHFLKRRFVAGLFLVFCLPILGCGGGVSAPVSDVSTAEALVRETLDAWKAGKSAADLKGQSPAVYFAEDLIVKGVALQGYSLDSAGEVYGTNIRFDVSLKCSDQREGEKTHKVRYLVCTTPACCISREE